MGQPKTKQTTQQTTLPKYLENAYKGVLKAGTNAASQPLQQYTGPRTAGFTPDQSAGFGMIRNAQGAALPYYNAASSMYSNVGGLPWGQTMGSTVDTNGVNGASGSGTTGLNWNSVPGSTVNAAGVNQAAQGVTGQTNWGQVPGSTINQSGVNQASQGITNNLNWGGLPGGTVDENTIRQGQQGIYGNLDYSGMPGGTVDWAGLDAASGAVMPNVDSYDSATMAQYMDPYMQGVIDPIMQRMQQEDAKQISNLKGSGIAMGISPALGDRMGLAASDLSGQQALSRNQTLGGLMSQGFQNAQTQLNNQQQLQLQGGTSDQARLMQVAQLRQQGRGQDADRLLSQIGQQGQFQQGDQQRLLDAAQLMQSGSAEDAARALQALTTQGNFSQADQGRLMEAQQMLQQGRQEDASRILQSLTTQNASRQQDASRLMDAQQLLQTGRSEDAGRALQSLISQGGFGQQDKDRLMQAQTLLQQGRQEDANRILQSLSTQQQGQLGAAAGMQGLGTAAQGSLYQGIDYLMNSGQMQQQQGQQQLDQTYADWAQRQGYSKDQVDWLANLIYGSPGKAATTNTTTEPGPSLLSQLLGVATTGIGLGKSFGQPAASTGGRIVHRDLGGAIVGDESYQLPRIAAPQINTAMYSLPQIDYGVPTNPGLNLGGETYINALDPLTMKDLGSPKNRVVNLPDNIRKPFRQIAKGINGGGGGGNKDDTDVNGGRGVIRRWPDGTIKSIGGKPVQHKAIGGGLLPDTTEPAPGTPEYDEALSARLAGPDPAALEADSAATPPPTTDLGGTPTKSRMGKFFSNVDPLVYAGLGIMGGESPFPLTNVGKGGAQGLAMAQELYASELDDKPMIDDSGPTVRYWTAGEGWTDTGIPSYKWASATNNTTGTEKERLMEGKYGPDWRKNPTALGEFEELLKTPSTIVDNKGPGAYETKSGEGYAERKFKVFDAAESAPALASTFGTIEQLLSKAYTGSLGPEVINPLKKFGSTVFGLELGDVAGVEVANQVKNAALGQMRETILGPGVMSNSDRAILESSFPSDANSPEAIALAVELSKLNAKAATEKARKLQEIIARDKTLDDTNWIEYLNWVEAHPFFTPEIVTAARERALARGVRKSPAVGVDLPSIEEKYGLPPIGGE